MTAQISPEIKQRYNFNGRFFDPFTGRFITEDPMRDGLLWFTFVNNNPMGFVDRNGFESSLPGAPPSTNNFDELAYYYNNIYNSDNSTSGQTLERSKPGNQNVVNGPTDNMYDVLPEDPMLDLHSEIISLYKELYALGIQGDLSPKIMRIMRSMGNDPFEFLNDETAIWFIQNTTTDETSPYLQPVRDGYLSSPYDIEREAIIGDDGTVYATEGHLAEDYAAPLGSSVTASYPGTVTFAGFRPGLGMSIDILHSNGTTTTYSHNQSNIAEVGSVVKIGQQIATVGSFGTGPHNHYTVQHAGNYDKYAAIETRTIPWRN